MGGEKRHGSAFELLVKDEAHLDGGIVLRQLLKQRGRQAGASISKVVQENVVALL
jgi:hypothetical protein